VYPPSAIPGARQEEHVRSFRPHRPLILVGLLAVAVLASTAPVAAAAPAPTGDFQLKGSYKNSAGTALALAPLGAPTFQTVSVGGTNRKALVFAQGDGLTLTGIPQSARQTYTIDIWFEYDSVACYQRILSFGPNDTDDGLYICDGGIYLYPYSDQKLAVVAASKWTHVRVTRSRTTKRVQIYVNGRLTNVALDFTNAMLLRQGTVDFLQDDGGDNPSGTVAGVRFWNKVVAP
jgi:hypothetical protein